MDWWALLLFTAMLLPNIVWMVWPPACDPLAVPSCTPVADMISGVAQILMIAALVCLRWKSERKTGKSWITIAASCCAAYWLFWTMYYIGAQCPVLYVLMTIVPCLSFGAYALGRKNYPALACCAVFLAGHLYFAVANYCV